MSTVRPPSRLNQVFRFGEFEFSVRSGQLRKNGELLRLQYQPLRVLLVLLEYGGEVVTREEIRERAWPDDSIRDFDNSLRVAVAKLRQALGDDPDTPLYIETVPRRGYRWLYPVTVHESQPSILEPETIPAVPLLVVTSSAGLTSPAPPASVSLKPSPRAIQLRRVVVSVVLWVVVLAAIWYLRPQRDNPDPKVVPLTTYPGLEYMPAMSPDGKRVAFAWTGPNANDPYRVYVKQLGNDSAVRITETPPNACDSDPVWMPDGRSILFYRRFGPDSGIYQVPAQGGPAHQLATVSLHGSPAKRARFDVSPMSDAVVYPSRPPGQRHIALFLLDLRNQQSRQLTFPPPDSDGDADPVFSHDGKTIAFKRETLDLKQVYLVPAAGGKVRLLTEHNRADIDGLVWTLNDREILLGGRQLQRISASESTQKPSPVPYLPGPVIYPSLRGKALVYTQAWDNANIWRLKLRDLSRVAGEPTKLIASTRQQAAASFSPDDSQIAFQSDRSGTWEIWKANRDGTNVVQLTHFDGPLAGTPRWSPDGRQIAFDSRASNIPAIYVISAEGGTPRKITTGVAGNMVPGWSRDGKCVYYSSIRNGITNVWKMPVAGGPEQQVTTNGGIYAAESFDGKYVYYSRSQTDPTLWRVAVGGGEEEAVVGAPKPVDCSHWALGASGIYIVDANADLIFYDFAHRHSNKVTHQPEFLTDWSLALSSDGSEVLWAQIDARAADLMLVENFH